MKNNIENKTFLTDDFGKVLEISFPLKSFDHLEKVEKENKSRVKELKNISEEVVKNYLFENEQISGLHNAWTSTILINNKNDSQESSIIKLSSLEEKIILNASKQIISSATDFNYYVQFSIETGVKNIHLSGIHDSLKNPSPLFEQHITTSSFNLEALDLNNQIVPNKKIQNYSREKIKRLLPEMKENYISILSEKYPFVIAKNKKINVKLNYFGVEKSKYLPNSISFSAKEGLSKNTKEIARLSKELVISIQNQDDSDLSTMVKYEQVIPLIQVYSELGPDIKQLLMYQVQFLVWFDQKSIFSLAPLTLDNQFWKDFLNFKMERASISHKEKLMDKSDEYKLLQEWFEEFWKPISSKDKPMCIKQTLKGLKKNKENASVRKKATHYSNSIQTKIEKEIRYPALIIAQDVNNKHKFKFQFEKNFLVEYQINKDPVLIILKGEKTLNVCNLAKSKAANIRFRFKDELSEKRSDWVSNFTIPKKEKNTSVVSGNSQEIKIDIIKIIKLIPKELPKKIFAETFSDNLELFKEDAISIFSTLPTNFSQPEIKVEFSDDFKELINLKNSFLLVNSNDLSLSFEKLEIHESDKNYLRNIVQSFLIENKTKWTETEKNKRDQQEEKVKIEKLTKQQILFNEWLDKFEKSINSYEFFKNSKNLENLLKSNGESIKIDNKIIQVTSKDISHFQNLFNSVAGAFKEHSLRILSKMSTQITDSNISIKNRQVCLDGTISVSEDTLFKFESNWNKAEKNVQIKFKENVPSQNIQNKIKKLVKKIFLKIFWEVIKNSSIIKSLRNPNMLDNFLQIEEEKTKQQATKINIKNIEKNKLKAFDQYGEIIKNKTFGKDSFNDTSISSYIIKNDLIRSEDDSNVEKINNKKFKPSMYFEDSPLVNFLNNTRAEKYFITRFKSSLTNYHKYQEKFEKYSKNGSAPFKNKQIIKILRDVIIPILKIDEKLFLTLSPTQINSITDLKGNTWKNLFLTEALAQEIPLEYTAFITIPREILKEYYEKQK